MKLKDKLGRKRGSGNLIRIDITKNGKTEVRKKLAEFFFQGDCCRVEKIYLAAKGSLSFLR